VHYYFIIDKMSSRAGFGPRAVVWRPYCWRNFVSLRVRDFKWWRRRQHSV